MQREQIACVPFDPFGPQMRVALGVDQLNVNADPVARPPDGIGHCVKLVMRTESVYWENEND